MKVPFKNVVILASLEERSGDEIKRLKYSSFLDGVPNVFFMHVFNSRSHKHLPEGIAKDDFNAIREFVLSRLHSIRESILPHHENENKDVHGRCFFDRNDKIKIVEFLKDVNADLVIAPTRGEQGVEGLFADSYCYWLVANAPCDVLIIRPE